VPQKLAEIRRVGAVESVTIKLQKTTKPATIFISCARDGATRSLARKMASALASAGHTAQFNADARDTLPGSGAEQMKRADLVVALLSAHTVRSSSMAEELEAAIAQKKLVLPVRVQFHGELPYKLRPVDSVQLLWTSPKDTNDVLTKLVDTIDRIRSGGTPKPLPSAREVVPEPKDIAWRAEEAFASLSDAEQAIARRVFLRFVRVPRHGERAAVAAQEVPVAYLDASHVTISDRLVEDGLLKHREDTIGLADARLLEWPRLQKWCGEEAAFLAWRQEVALQLDAWEKAGKPRSGLLSDKEHSQSHTYLVERREDLTEREASYVLRSGSRRKQTTAVYGLAGLLVVVVVGTAWSRMGKDVVLPDAVVAKLTDPLQGAFVARAADGELLSSFATLAACEEHRKGAPGQTCSPRETALHCTDEGKPRCFDTAAACTKATGKCAVVQLPLASTFESCVERGLVSAKMDAEGIARLKTLVRPGADLSVSDTVAFVHRELSNPAQQSVVNTCARLHDVSAPVLATVVVRESVETREQRSPRPLTPLKGVRVVEGTLLDSCTTDADGRCSVLVRADPKAGTWELTFQKPPYVLASGGGRTSAYAREELATKEVEVALELPTPVTISPMRGGRMTPFVDVTPEYGGEAVTEECAKKGKTEGSECRTARTTMTEPARFYFFPAVASSTLGLTYTPQKSTPCKTTVTVNADSKAEFEVRECAAAATNDAGSVSTPNAKCPPRVVELLTSQLSDIEGVGFEIVAEIDDEGTVKRVTPKTVSARLLGKRVEAKRCIATFAFTPPPPAAPRSVACAGNAVVLPDAKFDIEAVPDNPAHFNGGGRHATWLEVVGGGNVMTLPSANGAPQAGPARLHVVSRETDSMKSPLTEWSCAKESDEMVRFTTPARANGPGLARIRFIRRPEPKH
jgi:hypothetical protein